MLASCDVINVNDRFIDTEHSTSDRTVLLVDFTGWQCVNCPEAAKTAQQLQAAYPENFIVVSMHPKGSTFTKEGKPDFATEEGLRYLEAFGGSTASALPAGVVDMTRTAGDYFVDYQQWAPAVANRFTVPVDYTLNVSATETECDYTVSGSASASGNVRLLLWLVEDSIVAPQVTKEGSNPTYMHRHVFRRCLNGTDIWGDPIADPKNAKGSVSYTLPEKIGERFIVVAVLIDADTHEVLQAAEAEIGGQGGGSGEDEGDYSAFVCDAQGYPYTDGDTIDVTEFDPILGEMMFHGYIVNLKNETVSVTIDETRNFDYSLYTVTMCVYNKCQPDKPDAPGHWGPYSFEPGQMSDFQSHIMIPSAEQAEPHEFMTTYLFSDGTDQVTLHVRFHYTPQ